MFDIAEFIKTNLKSGYDNGSFSLEQVNIFALNYLMKGQISQSDFDEIQLHLNPITEEIIPVADFVSCLSDMELTNEEWENLLKKNGFTQSQIDNILN